MRKSGPSDFRLLLEEWKTVFPEGDNYVEGRPEKALRWLFSNWLMKDGEGFLKMAIAPDFEYSPWAAQVAVKMVPEKVAELLFGPDFGKLNELFVDTAAEELAEQHPALYLKMNPDGSIDLTPGMGNDDWETAITNLAKTDAVATANACLKSKSQFYAAILAVAKAWKPGDPPMSDWVNAIADPKLRNIASHARLCALAERDPRAALTELMASRLEKESDLRYDAPSEILTHLAKADPIGALKLMKDVEDVFSKYKRGPFEEPSEEEKLSKVASPFSDLSPGRYSGGDEVENNGVRREVLETVAENLPDDPNQLFIALHKLSSDMGIGDSSWQRGVEAGLIRLKSANWSAEECLAAIALWKADSNGDLDETALRTLATRAARANAGQVLAALEQLPEFARPMFAGEIIKHLPDDHPQENIRLLGQLTPTQWDEDLGNALGGNAAAYAEAVASLPAATTLGARESFMTQWGKQDPEAAACWLASLPDNEDSKPAAKGLADAWVSYDDYAASNWAASLPVGPTRDAAAASLSYAFARNLPDEAWQWANSISNPTSRTKALTDLDTRWQHDAPEKFRAALDDARRASGMTKRGAKPPPDPNDPFSDPDDPF